MKRLFVLILGLISLHSTYCQKEYVDSLIQLLKQEKHLSDSARVNRYIEIAGACYTRGGMPDTGMAYAIKAEELSKQIKWRRGIGLSIFYRTGYYFFKGNFPKCLASVFTGMQILEEEKDSAQVADCLRGIGFLYKMMDDYPRAIAYSRKAMILAEKMEDTAILIDGSKTIADSYLALNNPDSALSYYQEMYRLITKSSYKNDDITQSINYAGMARAYFALHDNDLAISYLNKSIRQVRDVGYTDPDIYKTYSEIKMDQQQYDSSLYYALISCRKEIEYGAPLPQSYKQLASAYEHFNKDSALRYYKMHYALKDSVFTAKSKSEIASLTENELERQRLVSESQQLDAFNRRRNIQFTGIGMALVTLVILFLSYSRSIIANEKLIRFLGVLGLLILFEFVNLLIHPFISHYTGESPVLMLLIMVVVAAMLIPLHHRIEKWIRGRLVEKNKAIRLASAKKTIAELEK